ncbi:MAG: hypothetical protein Q7S16_02215 [bacterium]|nr:hypothetical protein [bacterium]
MHRYREMPKQREMKEGVPETKVVLHFLRHEEGEPEREGLRNQDRELLPEARVRALERGKERVTHPEVSWAAGSERIRSAHTALLRMMSGKAAVTSEMTFEEATAEVQRELKELGGSKAKEEKKVGIRPELDYYFEGTPEFKKQSADRYKDGHGLEFFLEDSDTLARELHDRDSLSYSRCAANYTSLIAKYMDAGYAFNTVVKDNPEKYKTYENTMERFFGGHQIVGECFYMKVLEKLHGRDKARQFIRSFGDEAKAGNGFGFQEGFSVTITNGSSGQKIMLEGIHGFPDIELTPVLLRDIIADAKQLDMQTAGEAEASH